MYASELLKIKRLNLRISYKELLLLLAVFSNFSIDYIRKIEALYVLNLIVKFTLCAYMLAVLTRKKKPFSCISMLILGIAGCTLFSSILNMRGVSGAFSYCLTLLSVVCLAEYGLMYPRCFLHAIQLCCEIIVYWNLVSMLVYKNGMFGNIYTFILGIDNEHIRWLMPAQAFTLLFGYYEKKYFRTLLLTIAITASIVMRFSGTTLVSFVAFWGVFLIPVIRQKMTVIKSMIAYCAVFFMVVVYQTVFKYDIVKKIVVDYLGKDITFTNRIYTWQRTIKSILNNLIFGHGRATQYDYFKIIGDTYEHNLVLYFLFTGGVVLLMVFIIFLLQFGHDISNAEPEIRAIGNSLVLGLLISGITEFHFTVPFMLAFITLSNSLHLKKENKQLEFCR